VTYVAILTNLTCGQGVAVRVRAHNRQGPGGPSWYNSLGIDNAQLAKPLCKDGILVTLLLQGMFFDLKPRGNVVINRRCSRIFVISQQLHLETM
jgi:hypothetical protein